mgnify:CR=1 FL=1
MLVISAISNIGLLGFSVLGCFYLKLAGGRQNDIFLFYYYFSLSLSLSLSLSTYIPTFTFLAVIENKFTVCLMSVAMMGTTLVAWVVKIYHIAFSTHSAKGSGRFWDGVWVADPHCSRPTREHCTCPPGKNKWSVNLLYDQDSRCRLINLPAARSKHLVSLETSHGYVVLISSWTLARM